jgi:hypothetical protein
VRTPVRRGSGGAATPRARRSDFLFGTLGFFATALALFSYAVRAIQPPRKVEKMNRPYTVRETATALAWALQPETLGQDHQRIATGLAEEDAQPEGAPRPRDYRRHADWREMTDAFEDVMRERGIPFVPINW